MDVTYATDVVQRAVTAGEQRGYTYLVLPRRDVIEERVVGLGWYFIPREMETSPIPKVADELARPVYEAGVGVLQEIIGHEIPTVKEPTDKRRLVVAGIALSVCAVAVATLVAPPVAVPAVVAAPALSGTSVLVLAGSLALVDPSLILVLEDGTWLQCASWLEE